MYTVPSIHHVHTHTYIHIYIYTHHTHTHSKYTLHLYTACIMYIHICLPTHMTHIHTVCIMHITFVCSLYALTAIMSSAAICAEGWNLWLWEAGHWKRWPHPGGKMRESGECLFRLRWNEVCFPISNLQNHCLPIIWPSWKTSWVYPRRQLFFDRVSRISAC